MLQIKLFELINSFYNELRTRFPEVFANSNNINLYTYLRKNILLRCDSAMGVKDLEGKIKLSAENVAKYTNIPSFHEHKALNELANNFNAVRMKIQEDFKIDVRNFTVEDFYSQYCSLLKQA